MSLNLTDEQLESVKSGQPLRFAEGGTDFLLIRADLYEQVHGPLDDSPLTEQERRQLLQSFGKRAGWEDPEMDVYEDYAASGRFADEDCSRITVKSDRFQRQPPE
jgi:hypothetical protein